MENPIEDSSKKSPSEEKIRRLSEERRKQIKNAADYYGMTKNAFLKQKTIAWLDELPDYIKNFKKIA